MGPDGADGSRWSFAPPSLAVASFCDVTGLRLMSLSKRNDNGCSRRVKNQIGTRFWWMGSKRIRWDSSLPDLVLVIATITLSSCMFFRRCFGLWTVIKLSQTLFFLYLFKFQITGRLKNIRVRRTEFIQTNRIGFRYDTPGVSCRSGWYIFSCSFQTKPPSMPSHVFGS
jgi:hypothetical protein